MNAFLEKEVKISLIDFKATILKQSFSGMKEHLIVLPQLGLTSVEFKEYILAIEGELKKHYEVKRLQMLSSTSYLLKINFKKTIDEGTA